MRRDALQIVCLGGGHGLSAVLRGVKAAGVEPTAIVTLTDDGGSSGRLRRDLDIPPPGDIRNCLVALAEDESFMAGALNYRFSRGELAGHSLGNLFLAALTELEGSFDDAVAAISSILAIEGRVLPASHEPAHLVAEMEDGKVIAGETAVAAYRRQVARLRLEPQDPGAHPDAVSALLSANLIVMGPGSLFTSTIPPLLVPAIRTAVFASRARRIYIPNLLQQPGETIGYDAATHVQRLEQHIGDGLVDTLLLPPTRRVEAEGLIPVDFDRRALSALGVELVKSRITRAHQHDPLLLGRALVRQARRPAPERQ